MKKTLLILGLFIVGCEDKGRESLERCRKLLEAGEYEKGDRECFDAIENGVGFLSGREARALREQYKSQVNGALKARIEESWRSHAAEAQAAQAERKAYLARKVKAVWIRDSSGSYEDSFCQGDGYGPYWREYSGGTWAENQEAAGLDGCHSRAGNTGKDFCCPNGPKYVW